MEAIYGVMLEEGDKDDIEIDICACQHRQELYELRLRMLGSGDPNLKLVREGFHKNFVPKLIFGNLPKTNFKVCVSYPGDKFGTRFGTSFGHVWGMF